MMTCVRHLTNLYLVMSLLAWFPTGADAAVLCLEPNGRLIIDLGGVCCASPTSYSTDSGALREPVAGPDDCGPCLDIDLGGPDGQVAPGQLTVSSPPAFGHVIAGSYCPGTMLLTSHRVAPGPLPDPPPLVPPSRSIILRS
jgi:hypothetical protein